MDFGQLVKQARSFRRFDASKPVPLSELRALVTIARLAPSGGNQQPLRYWLISGAEACAAVFEHIAWAGALPQWPGPDPEQRPTGYIAIIGKGGAADCNTGIAAQTLQLAATARGLAVCMLGSIQRNAIAEIIALPAEYQIKLLLAVGIPAETVVIDEVESGAELNYYRTADDVHHVPKLSVDAVIAGITEQ